MTGTQSAVGKHSRCYCPLCQIGPCQLAQVAFVCICHTKHPCLAMHGFLLHVRHDSFTDCCVPVALHCQSMLHTSVVYFYCPSTAVARAPVAMQKSKRLSHINNTYAKYCQPCNLAGCRGPDGGCAIIRPHLLPELRGHVRCCTCTASSPILLDFVRACAVCVVTWCHSMTAAYMYGTRKPSAV